MAKKEEQMAATQAAEAQPASATPNRDKWMANLRGKYGEDKTDEELYGLSMDGYDSDHEAVKRYNDEANEFAARVEENPEIGAIFAGILDRSLTDENYGDNEMLSEYASRKKTKDAAAAETAQKEELDARRAQAFTEVCTEDGIADPEAALNELQAIFENPCETLEQCKEQARAFLKMVSYDSAVQAAEVRGRNANIAEQRRSVPKTAPQGAGAGISAQPSSATDIFGEIANSTKKQRDKYNNA